MVNVHLAHHLDKNDEQLSQLVNHLKTGNSPLPYRRPPIFPHNRSRCRKPCHSTELIHLMKTQNLSNPSNPHSELYHEWSLSAIRRRGGTYLAR